MKAHIIQGKQTREEIETLLCAWLAWTSLKKHAINKQTLAPLWEKTTNQSFYFHAFIELSESFALAIIKVATWQLTPYILCWKGGKCLVSPLLKQRGQLLGIESSLKPQGQTLRRCWRSEMPTQQSSQTDFPSRGLAPLQWILNIRTQHPKGCGCWSMKVFPIKLSE